MLVEKMKQQRIRSGAGSVVSQRLKIPLVKAGQPWRKWWSPPSVTSRQLALPEPALRPSAPQQLLRLSLFVPE
ncbi:hypothetical protein AA12467_1763 [Gluconobacter sphaericus NBRC 12467]|nr:hypothetical protein AA12467_1763 [Gluconobacter sphaericus NBRC 12467]